MNGKLRPYEPVLMTALRVSDALLGAVLPLLLSVCLKRYMNVYVVVAVIIFFMVLVCFHAAGVYGSWRTASVSAETRRLIGGCIAVYALLFFTGFVLKASAYLSRIVVLSWVVLWPMCLVVERAAIRSALKYSRSRGRNFRRAVIAGAGELAARVIGAVDENTWFGIEIVGVFDDKITGNSAGYPVLGRIELLPEFVKSHSIDIVYVTLPMRAEGKIEMLMKELSDSTASINLVPDVFVYQLLLGASIGILKNIPIIGLRESPLAGMNAVLKRIEDLVLASLILLIVSPSMLAVAIAIKLTSRGPVLFRQWRHGLNGQIIHVYKFRTMTVCEDGYQFKQASRCDPRVTRLGRFLRRTSIDELPQFINVLQGRMSIVGPRPHPVALNEQYRKLVSGYMLRHKVKPGITGLAQVNGWRGETDTVDKMEMRVHYDLEYLREWSVLLDLRIIAKTLLNNGRSSNAY